MNTSDILNAAADDLEANGWRQGSTGMSIPGPHCLLGSIAAAAGTGAYESPLCGGGAYHYEDAANTAAALVVADYLGVEVGGDGSGIYFWNDKFQRTASEVVEVLRAAALIAAASEVDVTVVEARLP